jgi:hypothetical protein
MTEPRIVRYVSGDWNAAGGQVRLRIESDKGEGPKDLLVALGDVLVRLVRTRCATKTGDAINHE